MTPREPDRFDAKADKLLARLVRWATGGGNDVDPGELAAALRAVEAETLERAARGIEATRDKVRGDGTFETYYRAGFFEAARTVRALKPDPAAAPAAETGIEMGEAEYLAILRDMGETRKEDAQAQGAEARDRVFNKAIGALSANEALRKEATDREARIAELETALRDIDQQCAECFLACNKCGHENGMSDLDIRLTVKDALSAPRTGEG